jgi:hypothetical protein
MLIGVLLFAQFAIASHACQKLGNNVQVARGPEAVALDGDTAAAADPEGVSVEMDQSSPAPCHDTAPSQDAISGNVCTEHCRYGHQTFDTGQLPSPAPVVFVVLYVLPASVGAESGGSMPSEAQAVLVAASPPHTILHCCFRI